MKPLNILIDELYNTFNECKLVLAEHQGGKMRGIKGAELTCFFRGLIELAIDKNQLPYSVETEYKVKIINGITVSCDLCVLDQNRNIIAFIECKDYTDLSMFKRFILDVMLMMTTSKTIQHISLSMHVASKKNKQNSLIKLLANNFNFSTIPVSFTLLPSKRISKNNLYLLDLPKEKVMQHATNLINNLSMVIK